MFAHQLPFQLFEKSPRELLGIDVAEQPIYIYNNNKFHKILKARQKITQEFVKSLLLKNINLVFVSLEDNQRIQENFLERLRANSRALSIGDPYENSMKHLSLMTLNLSNLYSSPLDDEILKLLFQTSGNFVNFLHQNKKILNKLYRQISTHPFHYSKLQPLLSSLLLLGYCQYLHQFSAREIETLFVTSYLKDVGMCYVPQDSLDKEKLSPEEKKALTVHPYNSTLLLENRVPLNRTSLEIVTHHHFLNDQIRQIRLGGVPQSNQDYAFGIETYLVGVFDVLTAMTTERPYRKASSLFESLDLIKNVMADQYPLEYKALIYFLKNFFKV
ncbi:MAG: hypothetical protein H6621_11660 [Halobacteriovoraceae bacterium]|nr:hypothetical protein [Halobacteriovoraceae bacterium]MCB9095716.1 hypothetical protein [Halobacteriovoraceae bacterium]